jgi:hypothetical protein
LQQTDFARQCRPETTFHRRKSSTPRRAESNGPTTSTVSKRTRPVRRSRDLLSPATHDLVDGDRRRDLHAGVGSTFGLGLDTS